MFRTFAELLRACRAGTVLAGRGIQDMQWIGSGASNGQILQYNGTQWNAASYDRAIYDSIFTYTGGTVNNGAVSSLSWLNTSDPLLEGVAILQAWIELITPVTMGSGGSLNIGPRIDPVRSFTGDISKSDPTFQTQGKITECAYMRENGSYRTNGGAQSVDIVVRPLGANLTAGSFRVHVMSTT